MSSLKASPPSSFANRSDHDEHDFNMIVPTSSTISSSTANGASTTNSPLEKTIRTMEESNVCVHPNHGHAFRPVNFFLTAMRKCDGCHEPLSSVIFGSGGIMNRSQTVKCVACGAMAHRGCALRGDLKWDSICPFHAPSLDFGEEASQPAAEAEDLEDVEFLDFEGEALVEETLQQEDNPQTRSENIVEGMETLIQDSLQKPESNDEEDDMMSESIGTQELSEEDESAKKNLPKKRVSVFAIFSKKTENQNADGSNRSKESDNIHDEGEATSDMAGQAEDEKQNSIQANEEPLVSLSSPVASTQFDVSTREINRRTSVALLQHLECMEATNAENIEATEAEPISPTSKTNIVAAFLLQRNNMIDEGVVYGDEHFEEVVSREQGLDKIHTHNVPFSFLKGNSTHSTRTLSIEDAQYGGNFQNVIEEDDGDDEPRRFSIFTSKLDPEEEERQQHRYHSSQGLLLEDDLPIVDDNSIDQDVVIGKDGKPTVVKSQSQRFRFFSRKQSERVIDENLPLDNIDNAEDNLDETDQAPVSKEGGQPQKQSSGRYSFFSPKKKELAKETAEEEEDSSEKTMSNDAVEGEKESTDKAEKEGDSEDANVEPKGKSGRRDSLGSLSNHGRKGDQHDDSAAQGSALGDEENQEKSRAFSLFAKRKKDKHSNNKGKEENTDPLSEETGDGIAEETKGSSRNFRLFSGKVADNEANTDQSDENREQQKSTRSSRFSLFSKRRNDDEDVPSEEVTVQLTGETNEKIDDHNDENAVTPEETKELTTRFSFFSPKKKADNQQEKDAKKNPDHVGKENEKDKAKDILNGPERKEPPKQLFSSFPTLVTEVPHHNGKPLDVPIWTEDGPPPHWANSPEDVQKTVQVRESEETLHYANHPFASVSKALQDNIPESIILRKFRFYSVYCFFF